MTGDELAVLLSEIFAFLIILFVLYRYVWPLLRPMVRQRQDAIQQQVDDAEEATRTLKEAEERYESALATARTEVARIRDDARADASRISEELRAQADREVERIRQRGEEQLVAQRDVTVRQLRAEIGALSLETAHRMIVESLSDDDRKRDTVDRFLAELDEMPGPADAGDDRQETPVGGADASGGKS